MTEPNRQLVTVREKSLKLREVLEQRKAEIQAALPRHITADKMLRLVFTACTKNPKLLECSPASVYGAVIQSAQLGLEPDLLGQAYLVPYYNSKKKESECQLIPGYKGLIALARRSGEITGVEARVVRDGDYFVHEFGLVPKLVHKPEPESAGELTHVYAIARIRGIPPELSQFEVMTKGQVEEIRSRSKAGSVGPWKTDYEAMALKTVLRRLCKLLPASVELQTAVELDEQAEVGLPQHLGVLRQVDAEFEPEEDPSGESAPEDAGTDDAGGADNSGADSSIPVCGKQLKGAEEGFGCGLEPGHEGDCLP